MTMSRTKQAVSNIFWLVLSEASSRAIMFLGTIYLARILDKAGFGLFSLSLAVASYFWAVADMGITGYGTREVVRNKEKAGQLYASLNSMRFFLALLLFLTFGVLLYFIDMNTEKKIVLLAGSFYAVAYSISADWIFRGLEKMQYIMIGRSITSLFFIIFIYIFVKTPEHSFMAAIIYSVSFFAGSLTFIIILRQKFDMPFRLQISFSDWLHHIKESIYFAINGLLNSIAVFISIFLIGIWSTSENLGIFAAPHRVTFMVINTGSLVTFALYPTLSGLFVADTDKFKSAFLKFRDTLIGISLPLCIVGSIMSKEIILFLFGASYIESARIFNVLIWLTFLALLRRSHAIALFSADLHKFNMFASGAGVLIIVLVSMAVIPVYGGYGAAWALVAGEILTLTLLGGLLIRKVYCSGFISSHLVKIIFASAVMFILIAYMPFSHIINVLIGSAIYCILSLSIGIVTAESIHQVYQKVVR